jgi:hypothetical protein
MKVDSREMACRGTGERHGWLRIAVLTVSVLAAGGLLSGCASSDGGGTMSKISGGFFGKDRPDDISQDYFTRPAYCPPIQIKGGTQAFVVYERGHDLDPLFVSHQASITKTARECVKTADGLAIKVGVAGRALAGPKGGPGTLTLPIRVVVSKQSGGVLYSELFKVPVDIAPPDLGIDFSKVFDNVAVPVGPDDRDLIVFVGFDEGATG